LKASPAPSATKRIAKRRPARISYDSGIDQFCALEIGQVDDGHLRDATEEPVEGVYVWRRGPRGRVIGFGIVDFSELDVFDCEQELFEDGPRFDVPTLGLRDAPVGEIVLAARATLDGHSTADAVFFDSALAAGTEGDLAQAEVWWRVCLQTGDMKAHFGLGCTLFDQGRHPEAYGHLRTYTEVTPRLSWAWLWRGRAAEEIGELDEGVSCYRRAIECERIGSAETDAEDRLDALEARRDRRRKRRARRKPSARKRRDSGGKRA
jgi:hypothetical protein